MCNASMAKRLVVPKLLWLLIIQSIFPCLHSGGCIGSERAALVSFKAVTADPRNMLSSWEGADCCRWRGVECSNRTGRVLSLDLAGLTGGFEGEISPALLHLKHLRRLDLSLIHFADINVSNSIPIPEFFGSFAHLRYLNLSRSGFSGEIPPQLGNLSRLRYLDLSSSDLSGQIPPELGNLSRLLYLDLWGSYFDADSLGWLQRLSSLKHLDLGRVNLAAARDWIYMVNMLPSLTFLNLGLCRLDFIPSHLPYVNLTSLQTLDLGYNNFNDTLPRWFSSLSSLTHLILDRCGFYGTVHDSIGHLTSIVVLDLGYNHFNDTFPLWFSNTSSLTYLDLSGSGFYGPVPDAISNHTSLVVLNLNGNDFDGRVPSFRNLCSLEGLDLSSNKFSGEDMDELVDRLPNCTERRLQRLELSSNRLSGRWTRGLEQMANLDTLDLSNNQLDGTVPAGIGKLSRLTTIDLSGNSFGGVVTEAHFANLTSLQWLLLSDNHLNISTDPAWAPPFQLGAIGLRSCQVGPSFPAWLQHQDGVSRLDLSGSGISGTVPGWFWTKFAPLLDYLDLSNNRIRGTLPESLQFSDIGFIFLRSNMFEGSLPPTLPYNADTLDLSDNRFSGPLPSILDAMYLSILDLSGNLFNSSIPSSWSSLRELQYLDLSDNNLSGEIVWPQSVNYLNLGNNHLDVTSSLGYLDGLEYLGLSNTSLSGPFPASLRTCKGLVSLDLSHNKVSGSLPTWLAESFPSLSVLLLRSNMLSGIIPPQLTQLHSLQILDLADNYLSGPIPRHLGNLTSMSSTTPEGAGAPEFVTIGPGNPDFKTGYYSSAVVFTKGQALDYTKNRYLMRSFDLSNNRLSGEIPEEIVDLAALINLNMSVNRLEGKIPEKIGSLRALESLDLSRNQLSGNIPLSLSSLNSLSRLNLSYNRLSGRIPSGYQLRTLNDDTSIYEGNPDLCGPPLPKSCPSNTTYNAGHDEDDDDGDERVWLYIGMGPGYVAGFWTVCGALLLKKRWRYAYFRFIDDMYDRLYVAVSLSLARAKRAWMRHGN